MKMYKNIESKIKRLFQSKRYIKQDAMLKDIQQQVSKVQDQISKVHKQVLATNRFLTHAFDPKDLKDYDPYRKQLKEYILLHLRLFDKFIDMVVLFLGTMI